MAEAINLVKEAERPLIWMNPGWPCWRRPLLKSLVVTSIVTVVAMVVMNALQLHEWTLTRQVRGFWPIASA